MNIENASRLCAELHKPMGNEIYGQPRNKHLADWVWESIVKQITDFEKNLPNDMQAGCCIVETPAGSYMSIDDVGCINPNLLVFYGHGAQGLHMRLVQHINQLNLLLVAVPRTDDTSKPRRKIGFVHPQAMQ